MTNLRYKECISCGIYHLPLDANECPKCNKPFYKMESLNPPEDILPTLKEINESIKSIKESLFELSKCVRTYNLVTDSKNPISLFCVEKWGD